MMDPRTDLTNEEWDTAYGLHSGYPQCCVTSFVEGRGGGPCKACRETGNDPIIHHCSDKHPACLPYLNDYVGIVEAFLDGRIAPCDPHHSEEGDFSILTTFVWHGPARQMLRSAGYLLTHICWPTMPASFQHSGSTYGEMVSYHYIFQKPDAGKGKCYLCNTKFSPEHRTTG